MLTKDKREQFEQILSSLFIWWCEHDERKNEHRFIHIMLEVMELAELFGGEKDEMFAINHNAHCRVCGRSTIDVDTYIENIRLGDILRGVNIDGGE